MKKIYSIVLMATALLLGTNVQAVEVASLAELQDAIANPNAEITLTNKITLSKTGQELDFQNATINANGYYLYVAYAKDFTLKNVIINGTGSNGVVLINKAANVKLVNFKATQTAGNYGAVRIKVAGATLNIDENSELKAAGNYAIYSAVEATIVNNGKLEAKSGAYLASGSFTNNGVINATKNYAIHFLNGLTFENGASATLSGKTIIHLSASGALNFTNNADAIYSIVSAENNTQAQNIVNNAGTLNFNGANISGAVKIENAAGASLNLASGAAGDLEIANEGNATISAGTYNGKIVSNGSKAVEVTGGTFTSEIAPEGLEVSGGIWSIQVPAAQVADGFACAQNLAGKWIVRAASDVNVASINGVGYEFLDAAFAAAKDGETIVLEADINNLDKPAILANKKAENRRSIKLDLNGHSITTTSIKDVIVILKGSLEITGTGEINNLSGHDHATGVFMYGSDEEMAADEIWSSLIVGPNVRITSDYLGVYVYVYIGSKGTASFGYDGYKVATGWAYANGIIDWQAKDCAFGVDIDIYGYVYGHDNGMNVTGYVKAPRADEENSTHIPFVHVHNGATLAAHATDAECAGLYMSGNAIYVIDEATITGANGIYVKGGELTLNGTTVTATGEYAAPTASGSGIEGSNGNAIVYDSHDSYTGNLVLTINDATVEATNANGGYAILDVNTKGEEKLTAEDITISGGTFSGGNAEGTGCLELTAELKDDVKVNGSITGGTFNENILDYLSDLDGMVTEITNEQGETVYYVEHIEGGAPDPSSWITDLSALATAAGDDDFKLTAAGTVEITGEVSCRLLQLLGAENVIIKNGGQLTVDNLVIDANAVVEVEVGAKLIVLDGGIVSNNVNSLVVDASAEGNGIVLIQPNTVNGKKADTNPHATVKFISNSFRNPKAGEYTVQRFGLPVKDLEGINNAKSIATAFARYDAEKDDWVVFGYLYASPAISLDDLKSSEYYQMLVNTSTPGTEFTFTGKLAGNSNVELNYFAEKWNCFANSFLGELDIKRVLGSLDGDIQKGIYVYIKDEDGSFKWDAIGKYTLDLAQKIAPMQAFIIKNNGAATTSTIDYDYMIWQSARGEGVDPVLAPARRLSQMVATMADIRVVGNKVADRVRVIVNDECSASLNDEGEMEKYMNEDLNIYVTDEKKMGVLATNDLNNTYVGVSTVSGGTFTIKFNNVFGEDLTLVDLVNGNRIAMIEGNEYEFEAEANSANDFRFQIVGTRNAATGVENISATNNGAVYTIMGQYVGEMSDWNILPAGIYVVDGVKRVK